MWTWPSFIYIVNHFKKMIPKSKTKMFASKVNNNYFRLRFPRTTIPSITVRMSTSGTIILQWGCQFVKYFPIPRADDTLPFRDSDFAALFPATNAPPNGMKIANGKHIFSQPNANIGTLDSLSVFLSQSPFFPGTVP